ncbi:MAG: LysR family transcriptional regulator [Polyangiales bacterium]
MFTDVTDMLLFAAVAQAGSLTRAGRALGLPKSTISRRIAALEERVGSRLLHKTTRKLVLTEAGEGFLDHCQRLSDAADDARRFAGDLSDRPQGTLRVTLPPDINEPRLHRAIAEFSARYPEIVLELDESQRFVDLATERYDLALRAGQLEDSASLVARRLTELCFGLFASPAYLADRPLPERPADLAQHTFAILQGRTRYDRLELQREAERVTVELPSRITTTTSGMQLRLALAGAAMIAYPVSQVTSELASGRLVRLLPAWQAAPNRLWIVTPSRRLLARKTVLFIDCLLASFGDAETQPDADQR